MTIPRKRVAGVVTAMLAVAAAVSVAAVSVASCAQTPPNVTPHTFRQAQKVDFICMQVNDANGNARPFPTPVAQAQCAPVPLNVNGALLEFHLYAVVTQTTPGELAVVDLTAGNVVDVDKSTPGVNFIPVGANPTDVAVAPGEAPAFTFVSSRDPNKMAIYAIDNARLLGNSTGTQPPQPLTLSDLKACALPQPPQALAVVPANAPDGGPSGSAYAVVVLLAAAGGASGMPGASVLTLDPSKLAAAAPGTLQPCSSLGAVLSVTPLSGDLPSSWAPGPAWPDGVPYADAGGPTPLPQCPGAAALGDGGAVVDSGGADDGGGAVVDGGSGDSDGGADVVAPPALPDAGAPDAVGFALPAVPSLQPHPTSMAMRSDMPLLYVADEAVPVIHVIDLHDPSNPTELEPLLATSLVEPLRRVAVGGIAISPTTHDFKTYLYAIDARQGTLMVYDVTDPATSPHSPLQRPHPELNPLALPDRLSFAAPVAAVAFVQHDWSLPSPAAPLDPIHQYTGLICNPNPNAHPDAGAFVDLGAYYRADQTARIQPTDTQGGTVITLPTRLRGIFGFVTLSNGNVVTVDVDDWDAPCRRPDPMAVGVVPDPSNASIQYDAGVTGVLDIPQSQDGGPGDLDPYQAPITYNSAIPGSAAVTLEAFFPVSAPHRLRSASLLRNDPTSGVHVPNLIGVPQLVNASGAPVSTSGSAAATNPILLPAPLSSGFIDPTYIQNPTEPNPSARVVPSPQLATASLTGKVPAALFPGLSASNTPGVRISFDDPTASVDQDWTVTYEGALPTVGGIAVTMASTDAYQTLTLSAPGASFCARGIEDWTIGQQRASQLIGALGDTGLPTPPAFVFTQQPTPPLAPLAQWTSDYVEIVDDLVAPNDPYWSSAATQVDGGPDDCWDGSLQNDQDPNVASNRYNACFQTFGAASTADTFLARDFPILQARDDSLVIGRFAWYPTDPKTNGVVAEQTTNRVVAHADASNAPFLRLATCCFHRQAASFKVRTGGEWVAVGSVVGLLHHVVRKPDAVGSCVLSCDPRDALMNARAFDVPWATWSQDTSNCAPAAAPAFDRDSPIAMRDPMFSYVMWGGCGKPAGYGDHTLSSRDLTWKYSVRGSFSPQTTPLVNPNNGTAVSPQSMRFVGPLGQLAVVDGETQGLILIDLNLVAVAHSYF